MGQLAYYLCWRKAACTQAPLGLDHPIAKLRITKEGYLMSKKLITGCLAVFALAAFIVPASSSASTITPPTGTTLATGVKITGTLTGGTAVMWNTAHTIKLLECTNAVITGTLNANDPEPREAITSAMFSGTGALKDERPECTGELGNSSVDTGFGN